MNTKLIQYEKKRIKVIATFDKTGYKHGFKHAIQTVRFTNIKDENLFFLASSLWMNMTNGFQKLDLKKGDVVCFEARVERYIRNNSSDCIPYGKPVIDYHLVYPTKIKKM